jgi:Spy/CpxP family protein refolding chaperone
MRMILAFAAGLFLVVSPAPAQPPGGGGNSRTDDVDSFVAKMMAFDKNKDGKLTRDEITDPRLLRLFDRADTKKTGVVTKEDLVALYQRENVGGGGRGGDGPGDRGGPGGPGGGGPGGPGGGRGRGGPPQPGQVLPAQMKDQLTLTDAQKKQLADLQQDVDARLDKILTPEQKARLKEMRERGPGGPGGGRGGPGGGGPGGPPPQ